ncbi:hypothetical protein CKO25_03175 [Thiocapsa imhoffii]|uniref:Uncharacterized protein n=1 Tax=Thiocapsa imhoffii TaxID=382777 RepID=A0A9X0WFE8_9GAMM|nr:hypothetical protein [Thiocapsa imhoffii]MBK1643677.1 hypothetical protein [Thiocapsa imhoffii]
MNAFAEDYRLADFKLLLPLRPDARVLVMGVRDLAFLPHLIAEIGGEIDCVGDETMLSSLPENVRSVTAPSGTYDLVFSDTATAGRYLRPGGVLCRFLGQGEDLDRKDVQLLGRWRAYPTWPAFRVLIPDHALGWRAAARHLWVFPTRSMVGLWARLAAGSVARRFPEQGIALSRRVGSAPASTMLDALRGALAARTQDPLRDTPLERWLITSGRLGPGNPILAFCLDEEGRPQRLIKAAREVGAQHLQIEAAQLEEIEQALGPALASRVIRPTASAVVAGRWALAYDFEPTHPFFGPRWRLQGRAHFCTGMADWLAALGCATRRTAAREEIQDRHVLPLQRLVARAILPHPLQRQAEQALDTLQRLAPSLPLILEHGDLGIYNARLTRPDGRDFRVLDWGSSTFAGIPLGDLCYLLSSARAPVHLARRCLDAYLVGMKRPTGEAPALWFSYLARRWEELDGIRKPVAGDPTSGGGILLATHARVASYLHALV